MNAVVVTQAHTLQTVLQKDQMGVDHTLYEIEHIHPCILLVRGIDAVWPQRPSPARS